MPNKNDDEDVPFTVPGFAREDAAEAAEPQRGDGRYVRGLSIRLGECLIKGRMAEYEIGALIDEVRSNGYWQRWAGGVTYTKFEDWTWDVLGYRARKADALRRNWKALSSMNLSDFALSCAIRVGWAKLTHIVRIARNEVELLRWCDRVNEPQPDTGRPMSETKLRHLVQEECGYHPNMVRSRDSGMDDDDEGGSERPARVQHKIVFRDLESYRSVMEVIQIIKQRFNPEMGDGEALALMATNYLSAYPTDNEGGAAVELDTLLRRIEAHYRLKLVPVENANPPASSSDAAITL